MDLAVYAAAGIVIACWLVWGSRRDARRTRQALEELTERVDRFMHANARARIMSQHAVTSAERAEKAAERSAERAEAGSVVVVVPSGGTVPQGEKN